jgi:hypothetical protein
MARGQVLKTSVPAIKITPPGRKLKNWLMAYGEYTADNEAPESFHLWIGLATIAGAARRNVYIQMQHFDVLTNMSIVLCAPAGTARKTTALKIGRNILKEVPGIHFTTKASSPAALIQQFASLPEKDQQSLTCVSYELGTFFSQNAAEMVDLATDLWDGNPDWDKQTISRGIEKITNPWFNFQAGTTPQWLGDYLTPTAVEGGWVARSLFIFADTRKLSNPIPRPKPELKKLRLELINDLTHISTLNGEFRFSAEAESFYHDWYLDPARFPRFVDPRISGYYERKHTHVLKTAMALAMAERDELVLEQRDIETALVLLKDIEPGYHKSFSAVGKNLHATDMERIAIQVAAAGANGLEYGDIIRRNYHSMPKRELDDVISQLEGAGVIKRNGKVYISARGL